MDYYGSNQLARAPMGVNGHLWRLRGNWLDRDHWYVKKHAKNDDPDVKFAPHFSDSDWFVPLLDGFSWVDRSLLWRLEALQFSDSVGGGFTRPRMESVTFFDVTYRHPKISFSDDNDSKICVYGSVESMPGSEHHFTIFRVRRPQMAAYRDVCEWLLDAAYAGREEELVGYLREYGKELVHLRGRNGTTALHLACETLKCGVVTILLENGASPLALRDDGLSPLLCCLKQRMDAKQQSSGKLVARRHHIAAALVAAGAVPKCSNWLLQRTRSRLFRSVDAPRLALVGQLRLNLALGFRCLVSGPTLLNYDILTVVASFMYPNDLGLCARTWHELEAGKVLHCADPLKLGKAKQKAGFLREVFVPTGSQMEHPKVTTKSGRGRRRGHPRRDARDPAPSKLCALFEHRRKFPKGGESADPCPAVQHGDINPRATLLTLSPLQQAVLESSNEYTPSRHQGKAGSEDVAMMPLGLVALAALGL